MPPSIAQPLWPLPKPCARPARIFRLLQNGNGRLPGLTTTSMQQKGALWLIGIVLIGSLASCVGRRDINYLRDKSLSTEGAKLFENKKFEYRVQVNDVLSIRVMGLDDATSKFFNVESANGTIGMTDASLYINGFGIDKNGQVELPTIGKVKVQGLTVPEAQDVIQRKINDRFNNATVILKLVSYRVSVLGDVQRPGTYFVYNNQITILEALAQAGGANEFADKEKVTLMRQSDRGVQAIYVDLGSTDVLTSEYYYLLPGDVVYVPTLRARVGRHNLDLLSILFAAVSAAALVVTVVNSQNQ